MVTTFAEDVEEAVKEVGSSVEKHEQEDMITTKIEKVTSKIPSSVFLGLGLASIGVSAALAASGRIRQANFVGMWVPTILILGLYNKLVKLHEPS